MAAPWRADARRAATERRGRAADPNCSAARTLLSSRRHWGPCLISSNFNELRRFGDDVALVLESGERVTYSQLADLCLDCATKLPEGRQLILLEARNDLSAVVAYLTAVGLGHAAILAGDLAEGNASRIIRAFSPTVIYSRGRFEQVAHAAPPVLHQDLMLLLPTSGSTGSPKLVRLSGRNVTSNADAIVEYLQIGRDDRAITTLPLNYSYGLSILNSHIRAGASLVLTDLSVTSPEFWELFEREGVTSLAGVPYSYELFERVGLRQRPPGALKTLTQAGGRLAPDLVEAYASFASRHGLRFYAMYGQTEASPRMAYLPPHLAEKSPDCIGVPIPGGSFRLVDTDGCEVHAAETVGELVYHGPNVMMGYAFSPDDLANGAEIAELRTGDLAKRTAGGLYKIVGRASRFVKIAGLRIGMDDLEALLSEHGKSCVVAGDDHRLAIASLDGADTAEIREFIARRCGLPIAAVVVFSLVEPPRLPTGKLDYQALVRRARDEAERSEAALGGGAIAAGYAKALGIPLPSEEESFVSLGGDSLAYVNASMAIERTLGRLPEGWERMPIRALEAMAPATAPVGRGSTAISSEIVLRVAALLFVTTRHASLGEANLLLGGSNVLFALAGYNLARFHGEALIQGKVWGALSSAFYRIVAPYLVILAVFVYISDVERSLSWPLLFSGFFVEDRGPLWVYWFIEAVVHALVITCLLFLVPWVRSASAKWPFATSLLLVAMGAAVMFTVPLLWNDGRGWHLTVDAWLYVYLLGWAAYTARGLAQKFVVAFLAVILTGLQYDFENMRHIWLGAALLVLLLFPYVRIPRNIAPVILNVAAASYFVYLTHIVPIHLFMVERQITPYLYLNVPILVLLSLLGGVAYAWVWMRLTTWVANRGRPLAFG